MDRASRFGKLKPHLPPQLRELLDGDVSEADARAIWVYLTFQRDTLSTYLPCHLVAQLARDPAPGQVSGGFRRGAVMLADVAGFTAMSERLAALGREGAEQITVIVNDFFNTMLEISSQRGGDLLKFGGDALLIFFKGEDGPRRAILAAAAMQRAMARFDEVETSQGVYSLQMSIGIGYGPVFLANLGSAEKMENAVLGEAVSSMARAEDRAGAGQIVVDQPTRDATLQVADYRQAEDDLWLIDRLRDDEATELLHDCLKQVAVIETLRPFLPDELYVRLTADPLRSALLGSHRPVTVLFANFYGLDEIVEALGPLHEDLITHILNIHFDTMRSIVTRHGGSINKVDTYAVGHRIVALFGAPQAHEDDPLRAVHAALEMNRVLEDVNQQAQRALSKALSPDFDLERMALQQRIGVNTGFVYAGNVGSEKRREYSVMGDEVNLAARLMGVAQNGEVLISHNTARHVQEHFTLEEKPLVKVKGKTRAVRSYVVTGARERAQRGQYTAVSPFVGRERELSEGKAAVERACAGRGSVLVISGVSGIGKTRLADEIMMYGQRAGATVLAGTCSSYSATMPHRPWAEILRAFFNIQPNDGIEARVTAVRRGLEPLGAKDWAPVIGDVLGLDIPDNDVTGELDAKLRRLRTLDLVLALFKIAAAKQPLVLTIEDVHWADPASIDLINFVASQVTDNRILFILTYRLDDGAPVWANYGHATSLPLGDLSDEACLEIARTMIGAAVLPDSLETFILSRTAGNPLFVEEVVRALVDANVLQQAPTGSWYLEQSLDTIALPDTIHGIIISRIDRLSQIDRQVLQVASVIGRSFAAPVLNRIYPYKDVRDTLVQRLGVLSELGLIEPESIRDRVYRFRHLTTWDVLYESQTFEQRRDLHRRIGHLLEEEYADAIIEQTSLLAYHYWEGHEWAKAMDFNLLAGRRAQGEYANEAAVTAYRRTLQAALHIQDDTTVIRLLAHESLAEVLTLRGEYDEALENLASTREMLPHGSLSPDRRLHLADVFRKTADVWVRRSAFGNAFEWLQKSLEQLDERDPTIELVRAYLLGIDIHRRQGQTDTAIDWCMRSLDIASRVRTREAQQAVAQVYYTLGDIFHTRGDLDRAEEYCQRSVALCQETDDMVELSQAYINLAKVYTSRGDWNNGEELLDKSMATKLKIGDVLQQGIIITMLGEIDLLRGDLPSAADRFKASEGIWQRIQAPLYQALSVCSLAQLHILRQEWPEARGCLEQSQSLLSTIGSEEYSAILERRWSKFFLKTGEPDQALTHAQRSLEAARRLQARLDEAKALRLMGMIHAVRKEVDAAQSCLRDGLHILAETGGRFEVARTLLELAKVGREREAIGVVQAHLDHAIRTFRQLGAESQLHCALALEQRVRRYSTQPETKSLD